MATKTKKPAVADDSEKGTISLPNRNRVSRLQNQALAKLGDAKGIRVKDAVGYRMAGEFALTIKEAENLVHELYDEHISAAHKVHKGLTDARKRLLDPLTEARTIVQRSMSDYDREQRRLAEEEAERVAAKEREKELRQAKKARDTELVKELQEAPLEIAPVDVPTPRVAGVVTKSVVKFNVVDPTRVPRKFLMVDEKAIAAYVKLHGIAATIEGVEVYEDVQTQIRS